MQTPDLPGDQFIPSNSDVGHAFIDQWCSHCARDKAAREGAEIEECDDNEVCQILGASFRGEAVEWRELPDGQVKCMAFVPAGQPLPTPRCPLTADMFASAGSAA